ncbi:sperm-associated antigen 1-like, partial [Lingula anatina]|uniref:Sperm-associated antigen 1-like n=1 Tax=Lingula anatina TaxID=7574 RepID=A0A1S3J250_LINAN
MAEDPAVRTAAYNAGGYCTKTHNIPVEHFEYSYIEKCNNVKELEKILLALRSGEEGVFPHLEQQCENKLRNLHPESRVLREVKPIGTLRDLSKEEQIELKDDLSDWLQQMKTTDTKLKTETGILGDEKLPPPRAVNTKTNEAKLANKSNKSNKRVKPRDYKEWDKVDIDAELEKIDKQPEEIKAKSVNKPKSGKLVDTLDPTGLTQAEKELKASREKDKGNEAFRSADYQEAVTYYSRSLSLCPSAASYNNRAIAYVKLCKWKKAIEDCDQVLQLEPGNIKACFRRALANKGCKDFQAAKEDLEQVLTVEPHNKKAQELLQQVEEELTKVKDKPKGRRLEIEEVGSSDSEGEEEETKENEEVCSDENDGSKSSKLVNGLSSHDSKTVENSNDIAQTGNCTASDIWGEGEIENNAESSSPVISAKPESDKQEETNPSLNEKVDIANKTVDLVMEKTDKTVTVDPPSEVSSDNPVQEAPKPRVVLLPVLPAKVLELKEEGNTLYKAGQYGEAIEKYTKAVDILHTMPDHYGNLSTIYSNRAACKSKIGDCSGCIKDCDRALELVPHSIKPILRRAAAYEASERFRQAYVDFKYALGIDGSIHSAHQGADRCRHMLQREDGVRWREKLPPIPSVLAYEIPVFTSDNSAIPSPSVTTATTLSAAGDRNESEADNGGSQRRPSDEERFFKLKAQGNDDVQKGNFKRAIESYTQCISLYPGRAVSYTNRALCYLRLNQ